MTTRRAVHVLSTGGTITMLGDGEGVRPTLTADALVAAVPTLADVADVTAETVSTVPGASLRPEDVLGVVAHAERAVLGGADGVVVVQGTDTLEETSFLADLVWDPAVPLVFTGAMRHPAQPGADGPANLLDAVTAAGSPHLAGAGVVVALGGDLHAARVVRKTDTASPAAFVSVGSGPLARVVEGRVRVGHRLGTPPRLPRPDATPLPPVALHRVTLGDDGRELALLADLGRAGVVIEGLGGGHVPAWLVEPLADLAAAMPVVLVTRTGGGPVLRDTYGFDGSERDLLARGLLHGGELDGPKARLLLTVALAADLDRAAIAALLDAWSPGFG